MPKVKHKERILKAAREKKFLTYRGVPIRPSADFSKETLQARGIGKKYLIMKSRDLEPRLLYLEKLSFRIEGQKLPRQEKTKGVHHHQTIIT